MIVDTNALSALGDGDRHLVRLLRVQGPHHLPAIVVGEYRFGLVKSRLRAQREQWLDGIEPTFVALSVDFMTARSYAYLREQLRIRGTPIPDNDLWIAALAHQHQLEIVSQDAHFDRVPGIGRREWSQGAPK